MSYISNKKKDIIVIIVAVVISIILVTFINSVYDNKLKRISNNIEIALESCKLENEKDSHGGFLGDGDYFARIACSNINYDELTKNWQALPLSEPLSEVINMKQCSSDSCKNVYDKFAIPNINDGYYYFYDRHSEANNRYDDTNLNNRSSWNFTLALLDKATNTIYYYELDT